MDRKHKTPQRMGTPFVWFQGVVEEVVDPKKMGRLKVRILGDHTQDKAFIDTMQLCWAHVMMPINSASMNGIGDTPVGVVTGTWVFGFYRDDFDKQQPVIIGSFGGIPEDVPDGGIGFNDPYELWPMVPKLFEPDTNRLARGVDGDYAMQYDHLVDITSRAEVQRGMPSCAEIWDEPETEREAIYPYNRVKETMYHPDLGSEWGHIEEWDDTSEKERYFRWHKTSHNSLEIFPDGREVRKIYGDNFELNLATKHLRIDGDYKVTIRGSVDEHIMGDKWTYIEGKQITVVDEDIITVCHKNIIEHSDEHNITKSKMGIHEVSLLNNNRITNSEIHDAAPIIKYIGEAEAVIGVGSIPVAVVPDIAPTDGYAYTPYDDITLSNITVNEAPGGKGGDMYSEIPPWDQAIDAAGTDFIKIIPAKIFNITTDEHHDGVNYMPELHVKTNTYTKDLDVELATKTNTIDVCDTIWVPNAEIDWADINKATVTTLLAGTTASGSVAANSVSTATLTAGGITGPATSVYTDESHSTSVMALTGTSGGSSAISDPAAASVGDPACPASPTPFEVDIADLADAIDYPDFVFVPRIVPVVPVPPVPPWVEPPEC